MDCSYEKSDIDCAAGSEELAFGSVVGSDSTECNYSECRVIYNLDYFGFDSVEVSEKPHFHCAQHSEH